MKQFISILLYIILAIAAGIAVGWWWRGRADAGAGGGPGWGNAGVGVEVVAVRSEPLAVTVEAVGTLQAAEAVDLTARAAGIVARIAFTEGGEVAAGAVLVELDAAAAAAALREAEARLANARRELALAEGLLPKGVGTAEGLDQKRYQIAVAEAQAAQAKARLADLTIVAPFAGRIGLRKVSLGALVAPGTVVATLVKTDPVKLAFAVPENHLAGLRTGLAVNGRSDAHPGRVFTGALAAIDASVDPTTRAVSVHAALPNPDGALRPGMFLAVELVVGQLPAALLVPEEAVVITGNAAQVFVIDGHVAHARPVTLGIRRRGTVQVVEGVKAGEQVAVRGLQFLREGAAVTLPGDPPPPGPGGPPAAAPAAGQKK